MQSNGTPERAAIYDRVSEDRRGTRRSVTEQHEENRSVCDANGWTVVGSYVDNDRSASRFATRERDDWLKLVADLGAGLFDVVVLWSSSRGGRELEAWAALLSACRRHDVRIHVTTHGRTYDMRRARDWRTLAEDGVDSSFESEKISEQVTRSMRAQAVAGRPHGRIPYGYRREYHPATGAFVAQVPDEETAPLIREMAKRILAGEPLYAIAKDLNRRDTKTPTGRPWDLTRVRQIVLNPTIAGFRVFRGQVLDGVAAAWKPIITPDTFAQLEAKLRDPRRKTYVDGSVKHFLVGIAICGVCGATVKRIKNRDCPSYACPRGFHVARKIALVDDLVEGVIIERLSRPDALDLLVDEVPDDVAAAREEVAGLRARLEGFVDQAADGKLSPTVLARIEAKLLPQIEAAEKRARPVLSSPLVAELVGNDVAARWAALTVPQRREVVRALLVPVINKTLKGRKNDYSSIAIKWNGQADE